MPRFDLVDVSNNNGLMTVANYLSMKKKGVKAIIQKLSEGTYYVDPYAKVNIANARKAGMYVHGYHFARFKTVAGAKAEAQLAVRVAKSCGLGKDSVIVNDYEASNLGWNANGAVNAAFESEVHRLGYPKTDIYTMGSWINSMPINNTKRRGWIANYPYDPSGKNYYTNYNGWQWTSGAHFADCYGSFDVTQLYGDFYLGGKIKKAKPTYYRTPGLYEVRIGQIHAYRDTAFKHKRHVRLRKYSRIYAVPIKTGSIYRLKTKIGYFTANKDYVKFIKKV